MLYNSVVLLNWDDYLLKRVSFSFQVLSEGLQFGSVLCQSNRSKNTISGVTLSPSIYFPPPPSSSSLPFPPSCLNAMCIHVCLWACGHHNVLVNVTRQLVGVSSLFLEIELRFSDLTVNIFTH